MYSVFSQVLREHWALIYKAKHRCKDVPTEIIPEPYDILKDYPNRGYPQFMYCHVISTLDYIAEEASYVYCTNSRVREVYKWVEKNIIYRVIWDNWKTLSVKVRIAVDMLNKLENEGVISKELNLFYFDNIVANSRELYLDTMFSNPDDDLPF